MCTISIAIALVLILYSRTERLRAYENNGDKPGVVYDLVLEDGKITSVRMYITKAESNGNIDGAEEIVLRDIHFSGKSVSFAGQVLPELSNSYILSVRDHGGYKYLDITYYDGFTDSILMTENGA